MKVVDFDLVDYKTIEESFVYDGNELSKAQGEVFEKKICTLLPVTDETNWKAKQHALLSYIKSGWTILDEKGDKVVFLVIGQTPNLFVFTDQLNLDPEVEWLKGTIVNTKVEKTPEEKMTEFKVELKALLAKYDMI